MTMRYTDLAVGHLRNRRSDPITEYELGDDESGETGGIAGTNGSLQDP